MCPRYPKSFQKYVRKVVRPGMKDEPKRGVNEQRHLSSIGFLLSRMFRGSSANTALDLAY
eukprot:scaffold1052_cov339-Pavlova_lutheri.AAC.58